jgi:hypothetical protein
VHVLTKIFIVLVSLLTVLLVPLVVVYAYNENSFQVRYQGAEAQSASLRSALSTAKASHPASELRKDARIQELEASNIDLRRQSDRQETEVRRLETRLAEAESMDTEIRTQLSTLTSSVDAGQKLTDSLIDELRGLRRDALSSERQKVELDEALRDTIAQLDAAVEARRALQEELQRLKDEHASAIEKIGEYVVLHGPLDTDRIESTFRGRMIDHDVDARIISVRRNEDQVLAEIDAGSRDGVKEGWVMTVGFGGTFIAKLRVISVDINRATGIVELEDEFNRGRVEVGQQVYARVGR